MAVAGAVGIGAGGWDRGGWDRPYRENREAPVDFSRAPAATPKKEATTNIVVMGDAMADWLAYGLEDAYSEKPDIGIVRKHRTDSGLIRYDPRRDNVDWAQTIREMIAADKPKFIVMMVGNNDRQAIREKAPVVVRPAPGTAKPAAPAQTITPDTKPPLDAELQRPATPEPPVPTTEQGRVAAYGPWEFQTEKWEAAYIKRVDAAMAALKSAGVPVLWVGLPSRSVAKASNDSSYLNEIYRSRAEKAGITYVDIWDGFVDEQGRYSAQGPDYEGQTRRLRSGDGVYFTKFGARKLAHYVEREIERHLANRSVPVALPIPVDPGPKGPGAAPTTKPSGTPQRPSAGPVLPLTAPPAASEELLGGGRDAGPPIADRSGRGPCHHERRADLGTGRPRRRLLLAAWDRRGRAGGGDAGGHDGRTEAAAAGRQRGAAQDRCAAEGRRRGAAARACSAAGLPPFVLQQSDAIVPRLRPLVIAPAADSPALNAADLPTRVAASRPIADLTWASRPSFYEPDRRPTAALGPRRECSRGPELPANGR